MPLPAGRGPCLEPGPDTHVTGAGRPESPTTNESTAAPRMRRLPRWPRLAGARSSSPVDPS
jgi:hypothetical protein